jgi:CobQ-like glutamine amidotransferase family enzyme
MNQKAALQIERVSEFKSFEGVVGYVNTEFDLPEISRVVNSVFTLFHGPVLAKNPQLADEIIANANWADVSLTSDKFDEVEKLAQASRQIAFEG